MIPLAAEAANPQTDPKRLKELAKDSTVAALVAANPNTPSEILFELAATYPEPFLTNPVLPLLFLENPDFPVKLPTEFIEGILRSENIPSAFLRAWQNLPPSRSKERYLLMMHVAVNGEAEDDWLTQARMMMNKTRDIPYLADWTYALPNFLPQWFVDDLPYLQYACEYAPISQEISQHNLELLATYRYYNARKHVAQNPNTPMPVLIQLANDSKKWVRITVAQQHRTPLLVLQQLASDAEPMVRRAVAQNPITPEPLLRQLAYDPDIWVRRAVISHPHTASDILSEYVDDQAPKVRAALAANVRVSVTTLEQLWGDKDEMVRKAAVMNPHLPIPLLLRSLDDIHDSVRMTAACSRRLPEDTLRSLVSSDDMPVRRGLAANPRLPVEEMPHFLASPDMDVYRALARNLHAPADILRVLATAPDSDVRQMVARHRLTPLAMLEQFAHETDANVLFQLACNPHTPFNILQRLMETHDWRIIHTVIHHPTVKHTEREELYRHMLLSVLLKTNTSLSHYLLNMEKTFTDCGCATAFMPESYYLAACDNLNWGTRFVVARNPAAPTAALDRLLHDGNRFVRAAARDNLRTRATT